jgi:hypothetical protein
MLTFKKYITMEKNETKERLSLKQYIMGLEYTFEEFDMDDFDGSYYTRFGTLDELFDEDQLNEAFENTCWFDSETKEWVELDETYEYVDQVSEEIIKELVSQLALALDQGAIKFLEIKDGDKVLYEDSNDEPFED